MEASGSIISNQCESARIGCYAFFSNLPGPVNIRTKLGLCFALAALTISCSRQPGAAEALSYVPADTVLLGDLDLARIRTAPLYGRLPPTVLSLLGPLRPASDAMLTSNGKDLLFIAHGDFQKAPAGMTLAAPGIALVGSEQAIRAALAQHKTGQNGAAILTARAGVIASGKPIWVIFQGGITLPLSGNAENLNRFLRRVDYAVVTAALDSSLELTAVGICPNPDAGRQLEENLRGLLTLATAAAAKRPDIRTLLETIHVERQDQTVRISLSVPPEQMDKLLLLAAP
jgi:hypothetical protein